MTLAKLEFLVWEEWGKVFKRNPVSYYFRRLAVDAVYLYQWEVFLIFLWWSNWAFYHITGLQSV